MIELIIPTAICILLCGLVLGWTMHLVITHLSTSSYPNSQQSDEASSEVYSSYSTASDLEMGCGGRESFRFNDSMV